MGIRWGQVPSTAAYVAQTSIAHGNRTERGLVGRESGAFGGMERKIRYLNAADKLTDQGSHAHRAVDIRTVAIMCQREEEGHPVVRSQVAG